MKKIKFAVIGFGHIGKKHVEVINQNNEAELVAIIDTVEPNIKPKQLFFPSLQNFFDSGVEADVINIATPNGLHATHTIECLQAGKHVVIEKPMALKTIDAQQIINVAAAKQKHVFVVMQLRYSPVIIGLKKLVDENALGKINFT